jgi:NAD(P)-dependent dehydrogenase (short-subunit alcohol dehydrogenase family)
MTRELLDILRTSAPARVVNVASTFASDLDLEDLEFEHRPYDGMQAYAQSKACDRMLTWVFARRLAATGVTANAIAPGLVTETACIATCPPMSATSFNSNHPAASLRARTLRYGWQLQPKSTAPAGGSTSNAPSNHASSVTPKPRRGCGQSAKRSRTDRHRD